MVEVAFKMQNLVKKNLNWNDSKVERKENKTGSKGTQDRKKKHSENKGILEEKERTKEKDFKYSNVLPRRP